jgi:hypothetical protein
MLKERRRAHVEQREIGADDRSHGPPLRHLYGLLRPCRLRGKRSDLAKHPLDLVRKVHDAGSHARVGDLVRRAARADPLARQAVGHLFRLDARHLETGKTPGQLQVARRVQGDAGHLRGTVAKRSIELADACGDPVAPDGSVKRDRCRDREQMFKWTTLPSTSRTGQICRW